VFGQLEQAIGETAVVMFRKAQAFRHAKEAAEKEGSEPTPPEEADKWTNPN
jgi:hypothetical protein